jgi:FKBP-type peptidyl-prolyl cis-trans isomerase SlyD
MEGKAAGDVFKVEVQPEEAYGPHRQEMVKTVPRSAFQGVDEIEAGMVFQAQAADGSAQRIVIAGVEGDNVQVDGNHPLAGKVLRFDIEVVNVREATAEEIAHGHPH